MSNEENERKARENQADIELCRRAAEQLGEHFDSVQIFVTRHTPEQGGTRHVAWGSGNWFTRFGQVGNWLELEQEAGRSGVRSENREGG